MYVTYVYYVTYAFMRVCVCGMYLRMYVMYVCALCIVSVYVMYVCMICYVMLCMHVVVCTYVQRDVCMYVGM